MMVRGLSASVPVEGGDGVFGQPGGLRHLVDAPRLRALFHALEAGDALVHPRAVEGFVFKKEADCAEGERAVRAGQGHELVGGPSAGGRLATVHAHDAHPGVAGLVKPAGVGRVGFADVRAPEHEGLRVDDLVDRGGGGVRAEQLPSTLDAVLMQTSPAGMTLTPPAVRMVMSAASSLSRQSHRGEVRARRSAILSPCLARLWRSLSTTMSTASA